MTDTKVRIFVSSPSDLEHERALVRDIIESLAQEYCPYFQVEPVLWEQEALTAAQSFQAGLQRPAECEIVLVMLWTRLGTPLAKDPYDGMTGTEWEFVDAVGTSSGQSTPEVLVYRKTAPRLVDINNAEAIREAVEDRERLEAFFRTHFFNLDGSFRRAFRQFDSDSALRDLVETQLRKLLNRRISAERRFAADAADWRGCPFRGHSPFDVGDERVFTGREAETRDLIARLADLRGEGRGLLLLTGPSGVGKTSLIRAGLLPHLVRPFLFSDVMGCRWCLIEPDSGDPVEALAIALSAPGVLGDSLADFGLDAARLARLLISEPELGAKQVHAALIQTVPDGTARSDGLPGRLQLALILDPLDGIFATDRLESSRTQTFAGALAALAAQEGIWVIAALRSDRLAELESLPILAALLDTQSWFRLDPPATSRIRQVVEIPARVAGISYEERDRGSEQGLVDALESEANAVPHWPALLEQTLETLYRRTSARATAADDDRDRLLTLSDHRAIGGLEGCLLQNAETLWQGLDEDSRAALPMLCRALLTLEGDGRSRPRAREGDLLLLRRHPACARLLQSLIDARLVVTESVWDPASRARCPPVELRIRDWLRRVLVQTREEWRARSRRRQVSPPLDDLLATPPSDQEGEAAQRTEWQDHRAIASFIHPALYERWTPVREWLAARDSRRDLVLRAQISRQARLWKRTDCNLEYLLGETGYAAARVFSQAYAQELEPLEQELLDQSWSRLLFQRRRNRWALGSALAVLLVFVGITLYSVWDAAHQTRLGQQRALLREAEVAVDRGNTPKAVRLALQAGADLPVEATGVLGRTLFTNRLLAMLQGGYATAHHPRAPVFRDDGEQLVTLSRDDGARLWSRDGGGFRPGERLAEPASRIQRVVFAGDARNRMTIGIGAEGVWRLPAKPGKGPDWTCGGDEETTISLDPGGRFLAITHEASDGGIAICMLDLTRPGAPLWDRLQPGGTIRSLAFAPDGKRLVSASRDGLAHILDVATGDQQGTLPRDGSPGRPAIRVAYSPDGQLIAVASWGEQLRVYGRDGKLFAELGSVQRGGRRIRIHQSSVRALAFAPDSRSLVAGEGTGQVVRWDLPTGRPEILGEQDLGIEQLSVSQSLDPVLGESLVLSLSQDGTARLWGLETGRPVAVFGQDAAISEARFSPDGRLIMTSAEKDGSARLWSTEPVGNLASRLLADDHVRAIAMAEPGTPGATSAATKALMATAAYDGRIAVWEYERRDNSGPPVKRLSLTGHRGRIRQIAFSPSAQRLASAASDGTARVWDLATGEACALRVSSRKDTCRAEGAPDCPNVYEVLFAPDESWLLTTSGDSRQSVRIWDPERCAALPLPETLARIHGKVREAALATDAQDGVLVATGDDAGVLQVMRHDRHGTWSSLCRLEAHKAAITGLTFSHDAQWLAAASRDGRASLYRVDNGGCGEPRYLDPQAGRLYDIAFAPDDKALVTGSFENRAQVWTLDGTLLAELIGHRNRVTSVQFSPDGRWILTGSRDGAIKIWERPTHKHSEPIDRSLSLDARLGGVTEARFSPDGHRIGAGYWENAALLWRLWSEKSRPEPVLERTWGRDRARLALIREAVHFSETIGHEAADDAKAGH
jgi:WD40 repeat protein